MFRLSLQQRVSFAWNHSIDNDEIYIVQEICRTMFIDKSQMCQNNMVINKNTGKIFINHATFSLGHSTISQKWLSLISIRSKKNEATYHKCVGINGDCVENKQIYCLQINFFFLNLMHFNIFPRTLNFWIFCAFVHISLKINVNSNLPCKIWTWRYKRS